MRIVLPTKEAKEVADAIEKSQKMGTNVIIQACGFELVIWDDGEGCGSLTGYINDTAD